MRRRAGRIGWRSGHRPGTSQPLRGTRRDRCGIDLSTKFMSPSSDRWQLDSRGTPNAQQHRRSNAEKIPRVLTTSPRPRFQPPGHTRSHIVPLVVSRVAARQLSGAVLPGAGAMVGMLRLPETAPAPRSRRPGPCRPPPTSRAPSP
ncbi:phage DNA packaging protein J [Micromonospora sp. NPDC049204]|uniref:phage DNA packaging protein J n=1 Tax=Micromonospora sp. NPDC049204 TaxID=3154351 RepID=UPI0033D00CE3